MKFSLYQKLREILYLQNFGSNPDAYKFLNVNGHIGIDVNFGHLDAIRSGYDGIVVYARNDSIVVLTDPDIELKCIEAVYSHGQEYQFKEGDKIKAGDVLCYQNSSGPTVRLDESWSHLHYGERYAILTDNYQNQNLKWNFAYFSPIKYHILGINNGFEGFINPNLNCQTVLIRIAKAIERKENSPKEWNNPGAIKGLSGHFLRFTSYEQGFDYLCRYLERAITGKHSAYLKWGKNMTIYQFFKTYSPALDGNDPFKYAKDVVDWVGLKGINDLASDWLLTELDWAKKYNNAEKIIFPMSPENKEVIVRFNYISYLIKKLWSLIFKDKQ